MKEINFTCILDIKKIKFPNPTSFMASSKSVVDDAYPGDVIGLYDSGTFKIGDSLSEGEKLNFKGFLVSHQKFSKRSKTMTQ